MDERSAVGWSNPEYQSAWIRLGIWCVALVYVQQVEPQAASHPLTVPLFVTYLVLFIGLYLSILRWPVSWSRRHLALLIDISGTAAVIYLTANAVSPFFVLFLWIYLTYGARYGRGLLRRAVWITLPVYLGVVSLIGAWSSQTGPVLFVLLVLTLFPVYQYALIEKLHQARQAAEQADRAKGAFLANMSHEIRTPMHGILSLSRLLAKTELNEKQSGYVGLVLHSGEALMGILNDILDYAKIESDTVAVLAEPFSLPSLIQEVVELQRHRAREKGLAFQVHLPEPLPATVLGDARLLRQVLMNLLGNAIKFTPRGRVTLALDAPDGQGRWRFNIIDTGVGIAKSHQGALFERFKQSEEGFNRDHGGSGLGLAISKGLVEAMGGKIGFHSREGEGSQFWVELQLPAETAHPSETPAPPGPEVSGGVRILLVDDDAINCLAGQTLLEQAGHGVKVVNDGMAALEAVLAEVFDLVLMDVHMPRMDGIEATRRIRALADERKASLPIIGVTASVMREEQARYLQAGMNHVVAKPLDMDELDQAIARWA